MDSAAVALRLDYRSYRLLYAVSSLSITLDMQATETQRHRDVKTNDLFDFDPCFVLLIFSVTLWLI